MDEKKLDELAKPCWSFDHMSFNHVSFARSVLHAQDEELERLRKIEAAAVVCNDFPEWSGEAFYDSLLDLGKALRGEVGAGGTAAQKEPEWQNDVQAAFGGLVQTPQG